jgi:hypothetical protein
LNDSRKGDGLTQKAQKSSLIGAARPNKLEKSRTGQLPRGNPEFPILKALMIHEFVHFIQESI